MIKSKLIIHNATELSDLEALEYARETLKEMEKELEIGDSRYFVFDTGIKTQIEQNKTCKTIIIY